MDNTSPHNDDRRQEKRATVLFAALRTALADAGEHRLYRAGKLEGLFSSRSGPAGEAAANALRCGLLETVRTEVKGKTAIEWVRLTPKGVEHLYERDSPRTVLGELRELLHGTRAGIPGWLDEMLGELQKLATRFGDEMVRYQQRFDALTHRVEEALRRVEAGGPGMRHPIQELVPWGLDALTYLDHRKAGGGDDDCPMPELFEALRDKHPHLSIFQFHDGLRRLADNRAVRLEPFTAAPGRLPQPEYALLDGSHVLYHVGR